MRAKSGGRAGHLLEIQRTGWNGSRPLSTMKAAVQRGSSSTDQVTAAATRQPRTCGDTAWGTGTRQPSASTVTTGGTGRGTGTCQRSAWGVRGVRRAGITTPNLRGDTVRRPGTDTIHQPSACGENRAGPGRMRLRERSPRTDLPEQRPLPARRPLHGRGPAARSKPPPNSPTCRTATLPPRAQAAANRRARTPASRKHAMTSLAVETTSPGVPRAAVTA